MLIDFTLQRFAGAALIKFLPYPHRGDTHLLMPVIFAIANSMPCLDH